MAEGPTERDRAPGPRSRDSPSLGTVLTGLSLTQVVSWGALYYAFPVLAPAIAADTGWSPTTISAAFSGGLVTSALVGVPVGRLLDRLGPRQVMTWGSVLAGLAMVLIAWSPSLTAFALAWVVAGVAMSGVLYQPAFAALMRWYGARHLRALATLTLVAGLASTVFAPLAAVLGERLDWRGAYVALGIGLLVTTVPVHAVALRRPWPADEHADDEEASRDYASSVVRTRTFRLLAVGLTLASLAMYAALINLVALALERGVSTSVAAWALGLGGLGQVIGRMVYASTAHRLGLRARTALVFTLAALSTAALAVVPGDGLVLIALSMVAGFARGIATLLQATAVSDRWGPRSYGRLSGILAAPVVLATALAPWAGAATADLTGSYAITYVLLAVVGAVGAVLMVLSAPAARPGAGGTKGPVGGWGTG